MNLDEELRASIATHADAVMPAGELLARVHGIRRRRRNRRAVVAALIAFVTVIAVPYALVGRRSNPSPVPPIASVITTSATGSPLGRADMTIPDFPLVPDWLPAGAGAARVGVQGPMGVLRYPDRNLSVSVDSAPYRYDWEPVSTVPIDVNGRSGTLRRGDNIDIGGQNVAVAWRGPDDRYVTVQSIGRLSVSDVERFARALRAGAMTATAPAVVVTLVPIGWVLGFADDLGVCFAPATAVPQAPYSRSGLCAELDSVEDEAAIDYLGGGTALTVGGRAGEFYDRDRSVLWLRFDLGGGHHLYIRSAAEDGIPRLTREDFLAVAAGISARGR